MRQTTGYRETLFVRQYGLVTRTRLWLMWIAAWRRHLCMASHMTLWVVTCFTSANRILRQPLRLWLSHWATTPHVCRCVFLEYLLLSLVSRLGPLHKFFLVYFIVHISFSWQVHICTTGLIVTPPPSSPVTTATVFTFPSESSYSSIPVVGRVKQTQV